MSSSAKPTSTIRTILFTTVVAGFGLLFTFLLGPHALFEPKETIVVRRDAHGSGIELDSNSPRDHFWRRDDYSCGPGNPCHNGACCGVSGFCGYGATYCGAGCQSQCDAVAECGKDAVPANKTCPLNTCCSQYGFCGTTTEFCSDKCQSNCVDHPKPPSGQSGKPLDRVIGYYEAWSARSGCHKIAPRDLAIDALTHVNYAFAYIDPSTFEITTMDTATSADTFTDTADLKSIKPSLKVFVSIGGWTFSDNDTVTQPLFGTIASSAGNRQKFANNVVRFMNLYGFDGVDLDWEYPGAPDRGGTKQDTANYVSLLETLRSTFDHSGRSFGLTFTAPSSYWYLRWFDLPEMVKHVDWINLMSYDLHGVWDNLNPIGSIVQGHTNLTEIKLAVELFWRVGIPPGSISMGFGFYGRAFTLTDPSCTTPGCPFSGASRPGPCTNTGGYLGYYEIAALLGKQGASSLKRAIQPIHDKTAAVNYFTFDNDQWISYDDNTTLKQKTDWAKSVGIGGSLIWASDLDDDEYTQHTGLLGRSVKQTQDIDTHIVANPQKQVESLQAELGQQCYKFSDCVDLNNPQVATCSKGFTAVGWDDAGCGSKKCHCGKLICCPVNAAPKNCQWRGGKAGDCDGRCAAREVNIKGYRSSWGGGFKNDGNTNKCGRGIKVFCCEANDSDQLFDGCKLGPCGGGCPDGFDKTYPAAYNPSNPLGTCPYFYAAQDYCCPHPTRFKDCRWYAGDSNKRGFADCPNAHCEADEIEIAESSYGDSAFECAWGQKQAACCKLTDPGPSGPTNEVCSVDLCDLEPGYCDDPDVIPLNSKRELLAAFDSDENEHYAMLDGRDGGNGYPIKGTNGALLFTLAGLAWPSIRQLFRTPAGQRVPRRLYLLNDEDDCEITHVSSQPVPAGNDPFPSGTPVPHSAQSDHVWEQQIHPQIVRAGVTRVLPSGRQPITRTNFTLAFWRDRYQSAVLRQGLPIIGPGGVSPLIPSERVFQAGGSSENRQDLIPLAGQLNGPKGRMFRLVSPTAQATFRRLVDQAARSGNDADARVMLQHLRIPPAIFNWLNDPSAGQQPFNRAHSLVRQQYQLIQNEMPDAVNIADFFDEVIDDLFQTVENRAAGWMIDQLRYAQGVFDSTRDANGNRPNSYEAVNAALSSYRSQIQKMQLPRGENGGGTK